MAYASMSGRARTSPSNPQAFGVCQRCGSWVQRNTLQNQLEWRGAALMQTYIYVCRRCCDVPQEQLRAIVVPADPVPIYMPFVEPFLSDELTEMTLTPSATDPVTDIPIPNTTIMTTVSGQPMTPEPYGRPTGFEADGAMPLAGAVHYGRLLPVLSVVANGSDQIAVTCSLAHGLATDDQVFASGLANVLADGLFSVTVTTATAFSFQTYSPVPAGALLTGTARITTALAGLPLGYDRVQQVGP